MQPEERDAAYLWDMLQAANDIRVRLQIQILGRISTTRAAALPRPIYRNPSNTSIPRSKLNRH